MPHRLGIIIKIRVPGIARPKIVQQLPVRLKHKIYQRIVPDPRKQRVPVNITQEKLWVGQGRQVGLVLAVADDIIRSSNLVPLPEAALVLLNSETGARVVVASVLLIRHYALLF